MSNKLWITPIKFENLSDTSEDRFSWGVRVSDDYSDVVVDCLAQVEIPLDPMGLLVKVICLEQEDIEELIEHHLSAKDTRNGAYICDSWFAWEECLAAIGVAEEANLRKET